ncbi:restriction endonuclease subunit S [Nocardia cyriacigeorgica]|uniref:restriction endonuclease subunit S n=1 Tax=Nocardia cyriacigeorgica TaxID=135487 RepID=UPI0018939086|nr:restriction endonuclease subunit S [Nocardia cyriacigeorgica]MBF6439680.1 restriction endonuclease subunit S [Nocardia cyriacigeorgica]
MRYYAEMKPTNSPWLGEVPAHWELSRFRYEAVINGGQVDPREEPWNGMTLIAPNHIESNTGRILSVETAEEQGADSGKYRVEQGQLVYSKIRPALNKAAIAETEALCSADMYAMSFADRVEPRFALYYVLARPFHTFATIISMRVKMPKVNREELADAPWLVPPLDEQQAIARYLDRETARIDTLIEEQQRLIEILRERRAAVVDAALAPLSSWTRTTLKHILFGVDQGVSPQAEAGLADEPGTWGVLKTGCVNRGVFRQDEHKRLPSDFTFDPAIAVEVGDVIVSRASGSPNLVGSAAIVEYLDYQLILSDKLFRLRPKRLVDPRFLIWGLNSGQYRVQVRRAISGAEGLANNLPLSKLRAFEMHHPSLEEQRRIAAHLDEETARIDMLIEETARFVELARERRAALITAAVTGQIDVREMA